MKPEFSYSYLTNILQLAKERYEVRLLADGIRLKRPVLYLRHDIDISIERALKVAEIEASMGLRATYFVNPRSLLYNAAQHQSAIRRLIELGHEVGLHTGIEDDIDEGRQFIQGITGKPVWVVSWHRPTVEKLRGTPTINELVNCYSAKLMEGYLSDSRGRWWQDPIAYLQEPHECVQLLIHPIWWGKTDMTPVARLQELCNGNVKMSQALAQTVPNVWRHDGTYR